MNWQKFVISFIKKLRCESSEAESMFGNEIEIKMIENMKTELQLVFDIMVRLPIRKEVKGEIKYLQTKVMQMAFAFDLQVSADEIWQVEGFWARFN